MRKLSPRDRDTRNRRFSGSKLCSVDNGGKTLTRGKRLWPNQVTQVSKREVFWKHKLQGERSCKERGTADSEKLQVLNYEEIQRTRRREGRIGRKGQRQQRGRVGNHELDGRTGNLECRQGGKLKPWAEKSRLTAERLGCDGEARVEAEVGL